MPARLATLCLAAAVLVFAAGCSNTTTNSPDTEAPSVSFIAPVAGDTVGVATVSVGLSASDNEGVTQIDIFLDGATTPAASLTAAPWQTNIDISALADGAHTLTAKAFDAAGNRDTASARSFVKGVRSVDVVQRMVLVEIITSANCTPCGPANEFYRAQTHTPVYEPRLATIKYHAPIPRSTDKLWQASQTWGRPRMTYLFAPTAFELGSAPNAWVDGAYMANTPQNWVSQLNQNLTVPPDAKIELSVTNSGDVRNLSIAVTGLTTSFSDLRLHTVVTEDDIEYNDGNSENIHYEVMRTMLPDGDGESFSLGRGERKTFTRQITLNAAWNPAKLTAVVFVQSRTNKYVLQAAKIRL